MNYMIREMKKTEYSLLSDFLYEAIYIPQGAEAPPRSIIESPELQVYVEHFGTRRADYALAAEVDGKVIGAVWVRVMNDYGHIGAVRMYQRLGFQIIDENKEEYLMMNELSRRC